jgi:hypothetical protein
MRVRTSGISTGHCRRISGGRRRSPSARRGDGGDLDRLLVEKMLGGQDARVLPRQGPSPKGKDAAIRLVSAEIAAGTRRLILALDLNGGTAEDLRGEVERRVSAPASAFRLWPIGLPDDPVLRDYEVSRYMAEDLIVKALHDPECRAKFERSEDKVRIPAGSNPWVTVKRLVKSAREDGYAVDSSKDLLRIFLALIRFGGSLAAVGERVIRQAEGTPAAAVFERPQSFELP